MVTALPRNSFSFGWLYWIILLAAVVMGGKVFDQVVASQHFWDATHECDRQAKEAALKPGTWWCWTYEKNDNDGLKYKVQVKTPFGLVNLVVVVCSCAGGGGIMLKLITGYCKGKQRYR